MERVQRPGVGESVAALGIVARATARADARRGRGRSSPATRAVPRVLVRALVTVPLAAAHARRFQRAGVEHVHAHFATYPTLAAWIAHRLAGTSYSFTPHAHDLFVHQAMLARKAADAAFVVGISEFNRRFLHEHVGAGLDVPIVHYGIDPTRFAFRVRPENEPPTIACVARLLPYKGHSVLLRALAGAEPPLAGARLELVGDGPMRDELEREAVRLGIGGRVWFHGSVAEPEVAAVLAEADVFALPSIIAPDGDMEGIPNALIEAMAAGLPAISTYQSGVPELIEDGRTGFLGAAGRRRRAPRRAHPRADRGRPGGAGSRCARGRRRAVQHAAVRAPARRAVHRGQRRRRFICPVCRLTATWRRAQHGDHRPHEDLHVHQERALAGVHEVERDLLREDRADVVGQRVVLVEDPALAEKGDLREADEARPHAEDLVVLEAVVGDEVRRLGPRADEAHVTAQDVPELRQLVELGLGEERADPRQAIVLVHRERDA